MGGMKTTEQQESSPVVQIEIWPTREVSWRKCRERKENFRFNPTFCMLRI